MFYSQYVLAKKGPLGRVWLAAHWDKRLSKALVLQVDIGKSIDAIIAPQAPMALRMSGHLLLGVVRIYSRKVRYLYGDASDALVKIKMAFRPGVVDLPQDASAMPFSAVTLPEGAMEGDLRLEGLGTDAMMDLMATAMDTAIASAADITLPEPSGLLSGMSGVGGLLAAAAANAEDDFVVFEPARKANDDGENGEDAMMEDGLNAMIEDGGVPSLNKTNSSLDLDASIEVGRAAAEIPAVPVTPGGGLGPDGGDFGLEPFPDDFGVAGDVDPLALPDISVPDGDVSLGLDAMGDSLLNTDPTAPGAGDAPATPVRRSGLSFGGQQAPPASPPNVTMRRPATNARLKRMGAWFDDATEFSPADVQQSLKDTSPIVRPANIAPKSRAAMRRRLREAAGPEVYMRLPAYTGVAPALKAMLSARSVKTARPLDGTIDETNTSIEVGRAEGPVDDPGFDFDPLAAGPELGGDDSVAKGALDLPMDDSFGAPMDDSFALPDLGGPGADDGAGVGGDEAAVPGRLSEALGEDGSPKPTETDGAVAGGRSSQAAAPSWSTRTSKALEYFKKQVPEGGELNFNAHFGKQSRRAVAKVFFETLVLKSRSYVTVEQSKPYGELAIRAGRNFHAGASAIDSQA